MSSLRARTLRVAAVSSALYALYTYPPRSGHWISESPILGVPQGSSLDSSGRYLAGTTWSKSLTWLPMRQTQEKRLGELAPQGHPSPGAMGLQGLRTGHPLSQTGSPEPRGNQTEAAPLNPTRILSFSSTSLPAPGCLHAICLGSPKHRGQTGAPGQTRDLLLSPKSLSVRLRSRPEISCGPVLPRSPRGPQPGGSEAQGSMQHGNSESSEHLRREKFASLGGGARKSHV